MKIRFGKPVPLFLLTALVSVLAGPARASVEVPAGVVGEVSLVVGKAWIQHAGAGRERIRKGTRISVSDTIETSSGGLVHVRFVDDALVSVRPASLLEVLRYDYDAARPAESAVRFDLKEGVLRAISGEAAKNARQNFRLNTPIAAIGVRGTDFVVSANSDSLRAFVTEGAIVVTRYSSECTADGFGACNQNGFEFAGGIGQIMQLSANTRDPVLLPLADSNVRATVAGASSLADNTQTESEESGTGDLYTDTVTTRVVNQTIAATRTNTPETSPPPPPPAPPPAPPPPPPLPEFTPDLPLDAPALTAERQLVWGRYAASEVNERITALYDPFDPTNTTFARYTGASGNNHYALFQRMTDDGAQSVQPGLHVVGFNLDKAQAQYTAAGITSLMDVNGGNLTIDFDRNRFATTLNLNHVATGPISLVDSGIIFSSGKFHSRSDTQVVAGVVSFDGKEAGYFFEKLLENGSIEGLTLWGKQP